MTTIIIFMHYLITTDQLEHEYEYGKKIQKCLIKMS